METKSSSLSNLYKKRPSKKSNSLPNLHTTSNHDCSTCSPSANKPLLTHPMTSVSVKVIPALLQKTWNKIKSINKKSASSSTIPRPSCSAPTTPNSFQNFDFFEPPSPALPPEEEERFDDDIIFSDPVQENYAKLQKRLSEELHQGQIQLGMKSCPGGGTSPNSKTKYCVSEEFRKKLQQWEMWKVSCGKVTYTDEELRLILPEDFSRKLREWESMRSGSPSGGGGPGGGSGGGGGGGSNVNSTSNKIEKQIQWLERQLEKVELEKGKLEIQMRKYLEKEARLEKMREALKNYPREQVLIRTPTAEGFAAGADEKFTKKLYEWEEMRGIPAEDGSMALLNPKYYHQVGRSSNSSEPPETEDIQETSHDEPEPNTPDTSSSLESINQASGSNTSSADFYQKSRRRSSDAVSTPLSARSPSLSAFTSDDEDNAGLLKTVEEEDAEEKSELPPPVVRANQFVVEDDEEDDYEEGFGSRVGGVFVPTKRTIFKPIDSPQESTSLSSVPGITEIIPSSSSSEIPGLRSPKLVRSVSNVTSSKTSTLTGPSPSLGRPPMATYSKSCPTPRSSSSSSSGSSSCTPNKTSSGLGETPSPGTSPSSPTKLRAEDIWNKNIDASPPPIRDVPKVVGFIPKLPPLPIPPPSGGNHSNPAGKNSPNLNSSYPGFTNSCYIQKPVFQHDGLKNFPRMGKAPVWVSPLVARRKMASSSFRDSSNSVHNGNKGGVDSQVEFTLDRFLEHSNLGGTLVSVGMAGCSGSGSKYTIGGGIPPPENSMRLISLSRSSSFGMGKLPSTSSSSSTVAFEGNCSSSSSMMDPPPPAPSGATVASGTSANGKVCKSKSASSIIKSSLNIFSKVRRSETVTNSNNNEPAQCVKTTRTRWFLNKF